MRRVIFVAMAVLATLALTTSAGWAGNAHFVETTTSCSDNTLTVSGKVAGLGDEPQICVAITSTAECINGGGQHPKAVNKESLSSTSDQPVQNGKADYSVTLTASFTPDCTPPMEVQFSNVTVTDNTNGLTVDP